MSAERNIELAREKVIETVMLFGQWPQPRPWATKQRPVRFTLYEFLFDTAGVSVIDPVEVREFFTLAIVDNEPHGEAHTQKVNFTKRIESALMLHFEDNHPLIQEVAAQIEEDEREEA